MTDRIGAFEHRYIPGQATSSTGDSSLNPTYPTVDELLSIFKSVRRPGSTQGQKRRSSYCQALAAAGLPTVMHDAALQLGMSESCLRKRIERAGGQVSASVLRPKRKWTRQDQCDVDVT